MFIKKIFKIFRPYIVIITLFFFFLLTIPSFVKLWTPCLNRIPGKTYTHQECVLSLALDRFMLLAMIGFIVGILYLFLFVYPRSLKKILAVAIILAGAIVFSYLNYIPESERAIKGANIIIYDPANK